MTDHLCAWSRGDDGALERMMPLVYERLRRLASGFLGAERRRDHTLQSAALVHEVYLRLIDLERISWNDRAHFYALCSRFMRRILVDHARRAASAKRGEAGVHLSLDDLEDLPGSSRHSDLVDLDDALRALADEDPDAARIVELRYFGGLDREEIAAVMGVGSATVTRRWRFARAWLYRALEQAEPAAVEAPGEMCP